MVTGLSGSANLSGVAGSRRLPSTAKPRHGTCIHGPGGLLCVARTESNAMLVAYGTQDLLWEASQAPALDGTRSKPACRCNRCPKRSRIQVRFTTPVCMSIWPFGSLRLMALSIRLAFRIRKICLQYTHGLWGSPNQFIQLFIRYKERIPKQVAHVAQQHDPRSSSACCSMSRLEPRQPSHEGFRA